MKEMKPIYTKDSIRVNLFVGAVIASLVLAACSPEPTPIAIPETPTPTLALPTDTIAPTEPPTQVPTIPPTPIPTAEPSCPDPTEGTQLLRNEAMGYCLLFPADYIQVDPLPYEVCLVPGEPFLLCHSAQAFFNVEDAAGRSASQVADEITASGGVVGERSSLTIAGVEAVVLPEVAGQVSMRVVIFVHDDRWSISTADAGNAYLPQFRADYNERFSREPASCHDQSTRMSSNAHARGASTTMVAANCTAAALRKSTSGQNTRW